MQKRLLNVAEYLLTGAGADLRRTGLHCGGSAPPQEGRR